MKFPSFECLLSAVKKLRRIFAPGDRLWWTAIWPGPLLAKLFGWDFLEVLTSLTDRLAIRSTIQECAPTRAGWKDSPNSIYLYRINIVIRFPMAIR